MGDITFKKKAPNAIRRNEEIKHGGKECDSGCQLNKQICVAEGSKLRNVSRRIGVGIAHKRNDDEDGKEELYSLVTVPDKGWWLIWAPWSLKKNN
uniref:Uncharacterized protein n=1 Tax=Kalanchoe fedtschenkoi TaxID=63787 RepID=A0A7N0TR87_KALFE